MDICSLLGPASSGFEMHCSLSHFRVGFIFQIIMLPLGFELAKEDLSRSVQNVVCCQITEQKSRKTLLTTLWSTYD